jgi:hypothetical protein
MSGVALRITSDLDKTAAAIARMRGRVQTAIARGLNEGGDKVRTQVRRAMREQTGLLKLQSVTKRSSTIRAFPTHPFYEIIFKGKPSTKPDEFAVKVRRGPGGGVTVRMWGIDHKFKRSFQQAVKGGLRMRLGRDRMPIRGFDGPNLAKEAVKGKVAETFLTLVPLIVPPMIDKHLAKLA